MEKDALDRKHGHVRHKLALVAKDGGVWVTDRAARSLAKSWIHPSIFASCSYKFICVTPAYITHCSKLRIFKAL
jgi:hypothetical protein